MRLINFVASLLLAGASLSGFVNAHPTASEGQLENPADEFTALALTLKNGGNPSHNAKCPAVPLNKKIAHTYTTNQIKNAYLGGAKLAANGKHVGSNKYPHVYNSAEKLPFNCGKDRMEFPILESNKVYSGEAPASDRVVFEYKKSKKDFTVKFCGVIRHGTGKDFFNCPKA